MPSRRLLLAQAAGLAGAALTPAAWTSAVAQTRMADDPFQLGVASGEPTPDGMVLWTRLAPKPLELGAGMTTAPVAVAWEIFEDEALKRTAARGHAMAVAEAGHSVHIEAAGLKPGREYWYRFTAAGHASPVGRTRTAPAAGSTVDKLMLAYGSCQKYSAGHYTAHAALAADRPDLVLFLGDYIYEEAHTGKGVRSHPVEEPVDLATYRHRYAWYKADPNLQAAHAAAPWMVIWDDHEVANDYGGDQDRSNPDPAVFLKRRAAAYQVYYENMPLRRPQKPVGPNMLLHRSLAWGDLAEVQFLDTRQNRDRRTCDAVSDGKRIPINCPERFDPARSLLGMPQERWLQDQFRKTRGHWNLLAQQYLMETFSTRLGTVGNDGWDGYAASRQRVLEGWRDARVSNPLVLGGDIHCFFAGEMALEPGGKPIASEFVGGSISSLGIEKPSDMQLLLAANRGLKFGDGQHRGYGRVEITPKAATVTFRGVADALVPNTPVTDIAKFVVESGAPGLTPVLEAIAAAAVVLMRLAAPEADQGVAVDAQSVYAVDNSEIARYDRKTGAKAAHFKGDPKLFPHMNSCAVIGRELVCAGSNFPATPMQSMVEVFDPSTLSHLRTMPLGHQFGSLTWVDRRDGSWWAGFANYDGRGGERGRDHRATTLVRFDDRWKPHESWTFPEPVLARLAPMSASGGALGADGRLYVTGHDRPELYVLDIPTGGGVLKLVATIEIPVNGQAIAFDGSQPGVMFGVNRPTREVLGFKLPALEGK